MARRNKRFLPRPYQTNAIEQVLKLYRNGGRKVLLHLPTGSGKTVIATLIIERLLPLIRDGKILLIAHRKELLDQTANTIKCHLPRLKISFEQGQRLADQNAQVIVASIQSLIHRKDAYRPELYSVIICDECHHALAPSWSEVIDYFYEQRNQDALLLGMTATPRRTDGRSAIRIFDKVGYEISKPELQDLGYLVPIRYWAVKASLCLDKVKMSGGDFQVGALTKVMNTPHIRALTLKAWESKGKMKKTLGFCASVEHAYQLAEDFSALGYRTEVIEGRTKNREEILERFRSGDIDLLMNYGVLTEGFDDPTTECILLARPTTSPLVYNQCLGRGLRPAPGKLDCTVIDIIDRTTHQLQYNSCQLANLPNGWNSKGRDPCRESRSISQIRVTDPDAFLAIRRASNLDEVQDILMALPPDIVVAGLDGEPVPNYQPVESFCSTEEGKKRIYSILKQAGARLKDLQVEPFAAEGEPGHAQLTFFVPEVNNEKYQYLIWHIERATGWTISFAPVPDKKYRKRSPKALLKSMLPEGNQFHEFSYDPSANRIVARVSGLNTELLNQIRATFEASSGIELDIQGQLSFDFF